MMLPSIFNKERCSADKPGVPFYAQAPGGQVDPKDLGIFSGLQKGVCCLFLAPSSSPDYLHVQLHWAQDILLIDWLKIHNPPCLVVQGGWQLYI